MTEQVPVSIVCRNDVELNGESPLLPHAYGVTVLARIILLKHRLNLLDRGFVYAIVISTLRDGASLVQRRSSSTR